MKKLLGTLFLLLLMGSAVASDTPWSATLGVVSDYRANGIDLSQRDPALQLGVEYDHPTGWYLGSFFSTVKWVSAAYGQGNWEADGYGGYRGSLVDGIGYDATLIRIFNPGHGAETPLLTTNPTTTLSALALTYRDFSLKYTQATSKDFVGWYGNGDTGGSHYLELNASFDLGSNWSLITHGGHEQVKNLGSADYYDYKLGVTKNLGFGVAGLSLVGTSTHSNDYLLGNVNMASRVMIASLSKTFNF